MHAVMDWQHPFFSVIRQHNKSHLLKLHINTSHEFTHVTLSIKIPCVKICVLILVALECKIPLKPFLQWLKSQ